MVGSWRFAFSPSSPPLLVRILALPPERRDKLRGVIIWGVLPWQERAPVLPLKQRKKKDVPATENCWSEVEDFILWIPLVSLRCPNWEKEEEEDRMSDLIHNFAARKRKRDASLEQVANAIPEVVEGSGQSRSDESSEVQAIVISSSPEMGLTDQLALENVTLAESREVSPSPMAIQVVHPLEQADGRSDIAKYTRSWHRRPLLLDRILMNLYLPPRGPALPMDEVSFPGPKAAQEIIDNSKPFNRGECSTDRLHELYPVMLRMPIDVRAEGQGEEYSVTVLAGTTKEDLQQMIEDEMQIRNRNFTESTELVSL